MMMVMMMILIVMINEDGDSDDDDDDAEPFGQERGKNYVRAIAFFVFPPPSANITGPCD